MRLLRIFSTFFLSTVLLQSSFAQTSKTGKVGNVIWFTPSRATAINGIALGPIESAIFDSTRQTVNGLTVTAAGFGILVPLIPSDPTDKYFEKGRSDIEVKKDLDSLYANWPQYSIKHNGMVLSGFGIITGQINGISISGLCGVTGKVNGIVINPFMNFTGIVNGISIGGFINSSIKVTGIQIGILNRAAFLKGLQIGIWNKTRKRSLPLINWG